MSVGVPLPLSHLLCWSICLSLSLYLSPFVSCSLSLSMFHSLSLSFSQPGVFSQLALAAEERPWLWIVYVLTIGLPVGLAVLFCWPKVSAQAEYDLDIMINHHSALECVILNGL